MATFLISEEYIKRYSQINGSVDSKYFMPAMKKIHDIELQKLLGTKLYKKILLLVTDGTIIDAPNVHYKYLVDEHLQRIALEYFCIEFFRVMSYKVSNGSLLKPSPEESETLSLEELHEQQNASLNNAEEYVNICMKWMCANSKLIPEYRQCSSGDIHPRKEAFTLNGL